MFRRTLVVAASALVLAGIALGPRSMAAETGPGPRLVFLIGEDEYKTETTLPAFIGRELDPLGFRSTVVLASPDDPNAFPGFEAIGEADLLVVSVRRRTPTKAMLDLVRAHLGAGKPLVGIRTASHAFALRNGQPPEGHAVWPDFDSEVLGGHYENHYGNKDGTDVSAIPEAAGHPILRGLGPVAFHSGGTLYKCDDLGPKAEPLLRGATVDKGKPVSHPVAWTNRFQDARVVYTSLGHPDDFVVPMFNRFLVNAIHWSLGQDVPAEGQTGRDRYKEGLAASEEVARRIRAFEGKGVVGDTSLPTPAAKALEGFTIRDDLEMDLVAAEPTIRQPLDLSWDRRGRLWVVQYLQYPFPAGLKVVRYDQYLRAVFDKVPAAPPDHVPGADRITVLEDSDGDGRFDTSKDVLKGLNIVSSVLVGRGGIWVLNPPYLLFYPDLDGDDVPDGDPKVCLAGFGLEDTHSVANSLEWGPDGWLYGVNGSTTTGTIQSGATKNLHWKGQMVWRYHPDTEVFEIFAEGGGNTFSLEIDAAGRVFSGTNNGKTRGMHYAQGGYAEKNWGKHGPLSNPYALGFYEHMRHEGFPERFTQALVIYQGGSLPADLDGALIAADALHNRVLVSDLHPDTSTYRTVDRPPLVTTEDRWFRPVDVEVGPDGAVYLADWYDSRLTHVDPRDNWHKDSGRIYRLRARGARPIPPFDLTRRSNAELIDLFDHPNKWFRLQAVLLLGERHASAELGKLRGLAGSDDPRALEALWALNLIGGFDNPAAIRALEHPDPDVRRWAVRLVGDRNRAAPDLASRLADLARTEPDVEVRSQLASTAKRLPAAAGLPIARALLGRAEDADDLHIPLLIWWAIESKAESDRGAVLALFEDRGTWSLPIVERSILSRLMQRYAMAGGRENLETCAQLLAMSPTAEGRATLMTGLMEAFRGREMTDLPPALAKALDTYQDGPGRSDLTLGIRRGDRRAIDAALNVVGDESADLAERLEAIEVLGEVREPKAVAPLLRLLATSPSSAIKRVAIHALMPFDDPKIAQVVLRQYQTTLPDEQGLRSAAQRLLASRADWSRLLLDEVDRTTIDPRSIGLEVVQQIRLHDDPGINRRVEKLWGKVRSSPAEARAEIDRLRSLLDAGPGDPRSGKVVFTKQCATCHRLFDEGGTVGPDLTGYERTNLDFMLLAIADPSAAIREEYTNFAVFTVDGRTLTGKIEAQDTRTLTLRGVDNQTTLIDRAQVEDLRALPTSIMPDGLVAPLSDAEARDLFAYLMSRAPIGH